MAETLTHWKKTMNPDYLGAWALQPGEEPILTIVSVGTEKVIGSDGKKEDCTVMRYKGIGPGKMVLNVTNCKAIEKVTGTPYTEQWKGAQIQVYSERVKAFGDVVDALRIRPTKPKVQSVPKCSDCGGEIKPAYNMTASDLAKYTAAKFEGAALCASCAEKRIAAQTAGEVTNETDAG